MKLRGFFFILTLLLLIVFSFTIYESHGSFSWLSVCIEILIIFVIFYLIFFYRKVVRPLQNIGNGMDLLQEQDFNSRLREVGQYEADKVVAIFNRMMEQLKNERLRLREQNQFLDLLIQASPMGVIVLNYDHEITSLNPAALKLLGLDTIEQLQGKTIAALKDVLPIDLSQVPLRSSRAISTYNGSVYKCTHQSFVEQGFPRSFYLIESLTEEVRLAEKKAYEKVIRIMSHEVNNTTASITSTLDSVEKALEEMNDTEDLREVMHVCIERCYGMSRFITNFADVVKVPEAQFSTVDLNEMIRSSIRFMEVMCKQKKIRLHFVPDETFHPVRLDTILFEQVLLNIIKNAVESIETEGDIYIRTFDENNTLEIADTGKGISKDVERKLFNPFFSTKPNGQGIGLLFIREVLIQHNCTYSLHTYPDGLTRFIIHF